MAYKVSWHLEGRIVHFLLTGNLTIEELAAGSNEIEQLFDEGTAPIHMISEVRDLGRYPMQIFQLKEAIRFVNRPELGWTAVVGLKGPSAVIANVFSKIARTRQKPFDTLEEAIAFLKEQDSSLEDAIDKT